MAAAALEMVREIADLFEDENLREHYLDSAAGRLGQATLREAAEDVRGVSYRQ